MVKGLSPPCPLPPVAESQIIASVRRQFIGMPMCTSRIFLGGGWDLIGKQVGKPKDMF